MFSSGKSEIQMDQLLVLPSQFISNIIAANPVNGKQWIQNLPNLIEGLCLQWDCKLESLMPALSYSLVAKVKRIRTGESAVLKVTPPGSTIQMEIKWLSQFKNISPHLIHWDESRSAFLMEECKPGSALVDYLKTNNDESVTQIICETIRTLYSFRNHDTSFKHLSELIPDLSSLSGIADPSLLSKAVSLFRDLTQDRSEDILLHGDLHHGNLIRHGESWKVIDPHGYMGDPAFEVGAFIYNPIDSFPRDRSLTQILESRLSIMVEQLPFDAKRIRSWAFCKTMLSAAWYAQDFKRKVESQLKIASILHSLI